MRSGTKRSVFTERRRREMFDELVAHPYGMAAMELCSDRAFNLAQQHGYGSLWAAELWTLSGEISAARAAARGRA